MRERAKRAGGVAFEVWAAFANDMETRLEPFGIVATKSYDPSGGRDRSAGPMSVLNVNDVNDVLNLHCQMFVKSFSLNGDIEAGLALLAWAEGCGLFLHSDTSPYPSIFGLLKACKVPDARRFWQRNSDTNSIRMARPGRALGNALG